MNKDNHFEYISLNTCPILMFLGSFWRVTRGFSGKIVLQVWVRVAGMIPAGLPVPLPSNSDVYIVLFRNHDAGEKFLVTIWDEGGRYYNYDYIIVSNNNWHRNYSKFN